MRAVASSCSERNPHEAHEQRDPKTSTAYKIPADEPRMRDKREVRAAWRRPDELTAQPRESAQAGDPLRHSVCFAMKETWVARPQVHFALRPQAFCQLKVN